MHFSYYTFWHRCEVYSYVVARFSLRIEREMLRCCATSKIHNLFVVTLRNTRLLLFRCSDEMTSARETYAYKRQHQRQLRQMRESANMNQNSDLAYNLIPRTFNPQARESVRVFFYVQFEFDVNASHRFNVPTTTSCFQAKPQDPQVFAKSLILKLEKLKKERDVEEIMAHKLSTVSCEVNFVFLFFHQLHS